MCAKERRTNKNGSGTRAQVRHDRTSGKANSRNNTSRVTNGGKSGSAGHKEGGKNEA